MKTKKKKQNSKISLKILGRILTIIIIMLVSLGSFVGIFKLEQNGTIKYIEIHDTISKKNFSSLSNIQKLNQGDQCTIYKKDGVIKYK